MASSRFPIPQGTLDMLILQVLSLGPAHGYGIAQRLDQISRSIVQVNQGSLYPALTDSSRKIGCRPSGSHRKRDVRPSSTR
jgi:DNA-binding PadR family transcriptional regulator